MDVQTLEKEAEMGHVGVRGGSQQKKSWWTAVLSVTGSNARHPQRSLQRRIRDTGTSLWSFVTGRRTRADRDDEGYVPLQTVEPA